MTVGIRALAGAFVTILGVVVCLRVLRRPPHLRQNFRGRDVVGTGGVALIGTLLAAWLVTPDPDAAAVVVAGVAMGVLGFVDDVYGDRRAGGLVGHARALLRGTLTTGMVKAAGGVVAGLAAAWLAGWRGAWLVAAGAVVALASNMANLFDLRPGRVIKVWLPLAVWVAAASGADAARDVLIGLAAGAAVFVVWELAERVMLGDTGAGLLGAALGAAAIGVLDTRGVLVAGAVLLALTLASEVVSFSRVIDAFPPLRFVDRLGRRP